MRHNIITLIICIVAFIGSITFFVNSHGSSDDDIIKEVTVSAVGITTNEIKDFSLSLNPSQSRDYEIHLKCNGDGAFRISLSFNEKKNGNMKSFVNVSILADGKSVYNGTLSELLDGKEKVSFDSYINHDKPTKIKITYSMSHEVGNEAQGTLSTFDILLNAQGPSAG